MNNIIIGFSSGQSITSKLIQKIQGTPYSHTYIRRNSKYGEYVYQASGLQVNFMNIKTFLDNHKVIEEYTFEVSDDKKDLIMTKLMDMVGQPYSIKQLVLIGIAMTIQGLKTKIYNYLKDDPNFICSKVVAIIFDVIDDKIDLSNYNMITPLDLNQMIRDYKVES